MTILTLKTISTSEVHNEKLFSNFDTSKDYFNYSLHVQRPKLLLYRKSLKCEPLGTWYLETARTKGRKTGQLLIARDKDTWDDVLIVPL